MTVIFIGLSVLTSHAAAPTDSDSLLKNVKNNYLRSVLWQNSSEVGLGPKQVRPLALPI